MAFTTEYRVDCDGCAANGPPVRGGFCEAIDAAEGVGFIRVGPSSCRHLCADCAARAHARGRCGAVDANR